MNVCLQNRFKILFGRFYYSHAFRFLVDYAKRTILYKYDVSILRIKGWTSKQVVLFFFSFFFITHQFKLSYFAMKSKRTSDERLFNYESYVLITVTYLHIINIIWIHFTSCYYCYYNSYRCSNRYTVELYFIFSVFSNMANINKWFWWSEFSSWNEFVIQFVILLQ